MVIVLANAFEDNIKKQRKTVQVLAVQKLVMQELVAQKELNRVSRQYCVCMLSFSGT